MKAVMNNLILKVKKYLIQQDFVKNGEKLAAAVSGGPDSVAMLFCLNELKEYFGFDLVIFHINHMMRGEESNRDEAFVQKLAKSFHIPFYSTRVDVAKYQKKLKCSIQVAAREVRYFHLNQFAIRHLIQKIATGHTANDQAETVLIRMLKGSGLRGISGIPPIRENKIIRPMLETTREEIEQFLLQNQIAFLIDSTNLKNNYLRNKIKNKLIPSLENEFNPSIIRTLCRSSQIFKGEDDFLSELVHSEFKKLVLKSNREILIMDAAHFQTLHIALARRVILDAIYKFSNSGRHVSLNIIENILQVIASKISGKSISIFKGLRFKYQYNQIIFQSQEKDFNRSPILQKKLVVPGKTKITEIAKEVVSTIIRKKELPREYKKIRPFTAFMDYSVSGKELFIRSRKQGDRFSPLGLKANKKLKDYFIDKKIPREQRDTVPLVTNNDSILWIIGHQISEFARIKKNTADVLMIKVR